MAPFQSAPLSVFTSLFFIGIVALLPIAAVAVGDAAPSPLTHNGGPLLTGPLNLAIVWYGPVGHIQKNTIRAFIDSLNYKDRSSKDPLVSSWWEVVESYQFFVGGKKPSAPHAPIPVHVVNQLTDLSYSVGKVLTTDFLKILVQKVSQGKPNTVAIIVASRGVTIQGICTGKCSEHGAIGTQPYVLVGNPETECPGACAWPFMKSDYNPSAVTFKPPSGNVGADSMVMSLASGLASVVTNPFNTGFKSPSAHMAYMNEAGTACPGMFGSGAKTGSPGKVLVDPLNGGAYNVANGKDRRFLLPALWNPKTSSCWTPLS